MDILEILSKYGVEVAEDKVADLNRDLRTNYKSKAEVQKIREKLTEAEAKLESYEAGDFEQKYNNLKLQYDKDILDRDTVIQSMKYDGAISRALQGVNFASERVKSSVINEIKSKNMKIKDTGEIEGLSDYLENLYKSEPDIFKNIGGGFNTWAGGSSGGPSSKDADYTKYFGRIQ